MGPAIARQWKHDEVHGSVPTSLFRVTISVALPTARLRDGPVAAQELALCPGHRRWLVGVIGLIAVTCTNVKHRSGITL